MIKPFFIMLTPTRKKKHLSYSSFKAERSASHIRIFSQDLGFRVLRAPNTQRLLVSIQTKRSSYTEGHRGLYAKNLSHFIVSVA